MKAPAGLLLLAALGGCVTGSYNHVVIDEPIDALTLATLQPGRDTLAACLARLGAPNHAFEYGIVADGSAGMALLWHWRDAAGWGLNVSSGDDNVPGRLSYDALTTELTGCMLWFGPDLVLERWRAGPVGELVPGRRRPQSPVEQ